MHWTWQALQETPAYVRRVFMDLTSIRRRAEAAALDKH